jgi:hypothetical protein
MCIRRNSQRLARLFVFAPWRPHTPKSVKDKD